MRVETGIVERLLTTPAVTAYVGPRVYNLVLPQGPVLPAVRVQSISEPVENHLRGASTIRRARVQIDVYAPKASGLDPYRLAEAIADAIEGALETPFTVGAPAEVRILSAELVTRMPIEEPDESDLVRMLLDWIVWNQRPQ